MDAILPTHPEVAVEMPAAVTKVGPFVQAIVNAATGNKWLPTPNPVLALVVAALAVYVAAQELAATRAKGTVTARKTAFRKLKLALAGLVAQVQAVADGLTPADAVVAIESNGFKVKGVSTHTKEPFTAVQGKTAGSVILGVLAVAGAIAYFWDMSMDKTTWNEVSATGGSKTTVTGLISGTTYYFRFRVLLKGGYGDWSTPIPYHVP